ncbi:MAG: SLC13 family permease [Lactobacillus sp.]|nr:SLC13 family permease [Lactobacillus sp.]
MSFTHFNHDKARRDANIVRNELIHDPILRVTIVVTIISLFFARPRLADINTHTLYSVAAMLVLIQIFSYLHVLDLVAYKLTSVADDTRKLNVVFTILATLAGMFLGNDITVLTLIPLYLKVAKQFKLPQILPVTLIGMGANIGAAFTPWGNPHNIFVVSHFNISPDVFFYWSLPYLIAAMIVALIVFKFIPRQHVPTQTTANIHVKRRMTLLTVLAFFVFFLGIFKIVPIIVPLVIAIVLALLINPRILLKIDYALLLTFTLFFIFVSDIQQIPWVLSVIDMTVHSATSTYWTSIIASQFMSNVPATILVGKFTSFAHALLLGSNIGGFGSMIGSMANMLVLKTFNKHATVDKKTFFKQWTLMQFIGLAILSLIGWALVIIHIN